MVGDSIRKPTIDKVWPNSHPYWAWPYDERCIAYKFNRKKTQVQLLYRATYHSPSPLKMIIHSKWSNSPMTSLVILPTSKRCLATLFLIILENSVTPILAYEPKHSHLAILFICLIINSVIFFPSIWEATNKHWVLINFKRKISKSRKNPILINFNQQNWRTEDPHYLSKSDKKKRFFIYISTFFCNPGQGKA